ncbi:EamA family transporter [Kribbella sp. NPDC003505]|uniref:EamA family transporter n=1 Tax=Kribbella sp. NPDC003505 TaxID=3154448 RepID=UPI0033AEFFD0
MAAIVGATGLWGCSGGVIAGLDVNGLAAAAIVELVTGVVLVALGLAQGGRPVAAIAGLGRLLPLLAVMETANVALYYVALQLAPVGPVMALHLTAPVMLTAVELARGRRRLTPAQVGSLLLICAALAVLGLGGRFVGNRPHLVVGLLLSLVSAGCIAVFITIVSKVAGKTSPTMGAGVQMLCSGLVLAPALFVIRVATDDLVSLVMTAASLFAPACLLYWRAMRDLAPITAGRVQLAEPLFGAVAAMAIFAIRPSGFEAFSAVLVLVAVLLELRAPLMES